MSCIACEDSFKKYGFSIVVGMKIFTQSEKACCPTRGVITSFDHILVKFRTLDGREHSKPFNEFMKSSWCDKSLY